MWGWGFYNLLGDEIVMWNLLFIFVRDYAYEVSVPGYDATPLIHLVVGSLLGGEFSYGSGVMWGHILLDPFLFIYIWNLGFLFPKDEGN